MKYYVVIIIKKGVVTVNLNTILKTLAKQNRTSVEEIRKEMEKAILNAKDTPNFKKTFGNNIPTLEEFIEKGIEMIADYKEGLK